MKTFWGLPCRFSARYAFLLLFILYRIYIFVKCIIQSVFLQTESWFKELLNFKYILNTKQKTLHVQFLWALIDDNINTTCIHVLIFYILKLDLYDKINLQINEK